VRQKLGKIAAKIAQNTRFEIPSFALPPIWHCGEKFNIDAQLHLFGYGMSSNVCEKVKAQSQIVKWNVIKTMIIVSISFVVSWSPINILTLHGIFVGPTTFTMVGLYPAMFLVYLDICTNPFIYGLKHEGVKQELARLFS